MAGTTNNLINEYYTKQVNIILTTIRKRSVEVMKRCTHKRCRDLLKTSYDIYVILNPTHCENFKFHQTLIVTMTMSILNAYSIDHCYQPNFNFLLFNSTNFDTIGDAVIINNRLNAFVKSLERKNISPTMISNHATLLNIDNFFLNYVVNEELFNKEKHTVSFFWKGEKKYIEEIYNNITKIIVHPSYVYKFYDVYFKFIISVIYYKISVFKHYLVIDNNPKSNKFNSNECEMFQQLCQLLLNNTNFPQHLLTLVDKIGQLSASVYDLCSQKVNFRKKVKKINKNRLEKQISKTFISYRRNMNSIEVQIDKIKLEIDNVFQTFGVFIQQGMRGISISLLQLIYNNVIKKSLFVEDIFKNMSMRFCDSVKSANKMFTSLIVNI
jgi:hypothetical protein